MLPTASCIVLMVDSSAILSPVKADAPSHHTLAEKISFVQPPALRLISFLR
jgi:hypothetical protein